ncbi:MAG: VIT1/CCC1 transporter family protein [Chlamydiota bacterium]
MFADHKPAEGKRGAEQLPGPPEVHRKVMPGHPVTFTENLKETSILLVGMATLLSQFGISVDKTLWILGLFSIGWFFWKLGRSSLSGWARLERLHRLIRQERWNIEHRRLQEKEKLTALYRQKGLTGKLLEQVIEVLMSDDNRLLRVILEEKLGLALETHDHPLKQASGAGLGVVVSVSTMFFGFFIGGFLGFLIVSTLLFSTATLIAGRREGNEPIKSLVWNLAVGVLATVSIHLIAQWIDHVFL